MKKLDQTGKKQYTIKIVQKFIENPVLFKIGPVIIIKYGIIIGITAFITISAFLIYIYYFKNQYFNLFTKFVLFLPLTTILGSYLLGYILRIKEIIKDINKIKEIHFFFFGGFIPSIIMLIILSIKYKINYLILSDILIPFLLFQHGLVKSACLNYGCCAGRPKKTHGFVIIYNSPLSKINRFHNFNNMPLYPVQIYEGAGCLFIGAFILFIQCIINITGLPSALYFILYGSLRYITEKYRYYKSDKKVNLWQFFSILLIISGIIMLLFITPYSQKDININTIQQNSIKPIIFLALNIFILYFIFYGIHFKKVGYWGD